MSGVKRYRATAHSSRGPAGAGRSCHFPGKLCCESQRFTVVLNLCAFTAMVSERNVENLVPPPQGPPHLSYVTYSCKAVYACEWQIMSARERAGQTVITLNQMLHLCCKTRYSTLKISSACIQMSKNRTILLNCAFKFFKKCSNPENSYIYLR